MSRNIDFKTWKIWTIRFIWIRRWYPHLVEMCCSCRDSKVWAGIARVKEIAECRDAG